MLSTLQRAFSSLNLKTREGLIISGLILVTFGIHVLSPVTTSTDSAWTFHVAASILQEGNVNLDEYRGLMDLDLDYRLRLINGHVYYYYPAATPLLITPAVVAINQAFALKRPYDFYTYLATHGPDERTAKLEKLIASAFVGLATGLMYLIARRSLETWKAIGIALIFAFATSMWSTASRALWQHGPSALLILVALYVTLAGRSRGWAAFITGLVLAFAYLVRPTNSLSFAFLGLYYLLNEPRRMWAYAAGAAVVLVPYSADNVINYSNLFPPYSFQLFERLGTPAQVGEALVGTLVSPNRGLFIFTPLFLFSIYGAIRSVAVGGLKRQNLGLYLAAILVSHWIVTSLFEDWGGAWSIGPRYFVEVIPLLVYFLIPVLEGPLLATTTWRVLFVAAAAFSILVQARGALSPYPFLWNGKPRALVEAPERKWDWTDLQFLRGLCAADPVEGRAPACWFEHS
ncbi:MAG TPA: hypothetical protein VFH29_01050 [Anaerolineales bacterium]|nr:hypothetical protein [Anaerolineales bacterium]